MKKYEMLPDESGLYRIGALINIPTHGVRVGDLGGLIAKEGNLSQRGNAWIGDNARISGDARISDKTDYIVFKNFWSSGRYFTWTRSNNMWSVGCFYGTGDELVKKAYADSERSGREYERVVRYVESILEDEKK